MGLLSWKALDWQISLHCPDRRPHASQQNISNTTDRTAVFVFGLGDYAGWWKAEGFSTLQAHRDLLGEKGLIGYVDIKKPSVGSGLP